MSATVVKYESNNSHQKNNIANDLESLSKRHNLKLGVIHDLLVDEWKILIRVKDVIDKLSQIYQKVTPLVLVLYILVFIIMSRKFKKL